MTVLPDLIIGTEPAAATECGHRFPGCPMRWFRSVADVDIRRGARVLLVGPWPVGFVQSDALTRFLVLLQDRGVTLLRGDLTEAVTLGR